MADKVSVLIPEEDIVKRLSEIGQQIDKDYAGEEILLICILKGSIFVTTELSKHITVPVKFDFMQVSSYGDDTKTSGRVKIVKDLDGEIYGKNVIVVEDIIDSGNTLAHLYSLLKLRNPKSIRLCTLLDKPDRREVEVNVDYVGFKIPDAFVVGFGLDYKQQYRNLPFVGVLELEKQE